MKKNTALPFIPEHAFDYQNQIPPQKPSSSLFFDTLVSGQLFRSFDLSHAVGENYQEPDQQMALSVISLWIKNHQSLSQARIINIEHRSECYIAHLLDEQNRHFLLKYHIKGWVLEAGGLEKMQHILNEPASCVNLAYPIAASNSPRIDCFHMVMHKSLRTHWTGMSSLFQLDSWQKQLGHYSELSGVWLGRLHAKTSQAAPFVTDAAFTQLFLAKYREIVPDSLLCSSWFESLKLLMQDCEGIPIYRVYSHGDYKIDNILVHDDGRVQIIDFDLNNKMGITYTDIGGFIASLYFSCLKRPLPQKSLFYAIKAFLQGYIKGWGDRSPQLHNRMLHAAIVSNLLFTYLTYEQVYKNQPLYRAIIQCRYKTWLNFWLNQDAPIRQLHAGS